MGAFCEYLHMPPREVLLLSIEEFDTLVGYLEAVARAQQKAAKDG